MKEIPKVIAQKSAARKKSRPKATKAKPAKAVDSENPWVKYAGIHENDPIFLEVLEIMKKEKQKRIHRAQREAK
jgi:hypothetical protein